MNKLISLRELKSRVMQAGNTLIISHQNPDPDTLGSALGLKWILAKLDKPANIICATKVSEKICGYLDIRPELDGAGDAVPEFDYIIAVDTASEAMLGQPLAQYDVDLVIDHHYTNTLFGRETYLDDKAAATGEIIFALAKELGLEIDREFAKHIYCAIVCDSGAFRFSATTPQTMRIAAELIATGFDFARLNRLIFDNKSLEQIKVERLAYNSLKLYSGGRIAVINITRELKKEAGLEGCEIEGISGIPRTVMGVEVGALIKEEDTAQDGDAREFRVSLRSNEYANVAEIASLFGGGGHARAAGFRFAAAPGFPEPDKYIEQLLIEKIERVL